MYQQKTLIVVLAMHRSGSSLTTNILQQLGMSLGPFALLGATPYNPYGHFEAVPIYELDRRLQQLVFGFTEDLPESREVFERFCRSEGCWPADVQIPAEMYREGRRLIEQLVASAEISGFKDPRVPLLWPFWSQVLAEFPGLQVVPLFVLRSPHEVAMSIFRRSRGVFAYHDVLEATAVHLARMWSIWESCTGRRTLIRFDPRYYQQDLSRAAAQCGLQWSAAAFRKTYDADCKHHEPVAVSHRSQALFERFTGIRGDYLSAENLAQADSDAALREQILREHLQRYRDTLADFHNDIDYFRRLLTQHDVEVANLRASLAEAQFRAVTAEGELRRIHSTRTWRMRKWLLQRLGVPVVEIGVAANAGARRTGANARPAGASEPQTPGNAKQAPTDATPAATDLEPATAKASQPAHSADELAATTRQPAAAWAKPGANVPQVFASQD